jgi:hypothetical protein
VVARAVSARAIAGALRRTSASSARRIPGGTDGLSRNGGGRARSKLSGERGVVRGGVVGVVRGRGGVDVVVGVLIRLKIRLGIGGRLQRLLDWRVVDDSRGLQVPRRRYFPSNTADQRWLRAGVLKAVADSVGSCLQRVSA